MARRRSDTMPTYMTDYLEILAHDFGPSAGDNICIREETGLKTYPYDDWTHGLYGQGKGGPGGGWVGVTHGTRPPNNTIQGGKTMFWHMISDRRGAITFA